MHTATKILLIAAAICVALYIGVFLGRTSHPQMIYLPASIPITTGDIAILNLNTATADELTMLPGISLSLAKEIVQYRNKYGDYVAVREHLELDSMTKEIYQGIEKYLTVDKIR